MRGWVRTLAVMVLAGVTAMGWAQERRTCTVDQTAPGEGEVALARGDYQKADELYSKALTADPKLVAAQLGLIRAELGEGKLDEAQALARRLAAAQPEDARVRAVVGEVAIRRGEPGEAEAAYNAAMKADPCSGRLSYDIGRYLQLTGMAATARRMLVTAHALSPKDPVIGAAWMQETGERETVPQRVTRLTAIVDAAGSTKEQKAQAAEGIKQLQAEERGSCTAVAPVTSTKLKMTSLEDGPQRRYGVALDVVMNGKRKRLQVDTGASGLLLNRASAISAGLVPEATGQTGGIGDEGASGGFVTHVDDLRIGEMEFKNCQVRVVEKRGVLDTDGLIGTDVFENYVVTLDIPMDELRLSQLPARPGGVVPTATLATSGDKISEETGTVGPVDRFVAPEMQQWTRIYRRGHLLIFPTKIGKAPTKLFVMDTGASISLISPAAAKEVTHVDTDESMQVRGLSGKVKKVSEADTITVQFGGVRQQMLGMTAIDTTGISQYAGMELAGFIGFPTLSELVIAIDYRDDLIHVVYDPNHGHYAH